MKHLQTFPLFEETFIRKIGNLDILGDELIELPEYKRMSWWNPRRVGHPVDNTRWYSLEIEIPYCNDKEIPITRRYDIDIYDKTLTRYENGTPYGNPDLQNLKLDSLEDWNNTFLKINAYMISKEILRAWLPEIEKLENALRGGPKCKDTSTILSVLVGKSTCKQRLPSMAKIAKELFQYEQNWSNSYNRHIEKNPTDTTPDHVRAAIDSGLLQPTEFTKALLDADSWGLMG